MTVVNLKKEILRLIRFIPVTDSDVLSWNSLTDLNQSHEEGQVAAIPVFIKGDKAEIIFSKRGSRLGVGNERIKDYVGNSEQEALNELADDLLYDANQDESKAIEFCKSTEWWEDIY